MQEIERIAKKCNFEQFQQSKTKKNNTFVMHLSMALLLHLYTNGSWNAAL